MQKQIKLVIEEIIDDIWNLFEGRHFHIFVHITNNIRELLSSRSGKRSTQVRRLCVFFSHGGGKDGDACRGDARRLSRHR